MFWKAAWIGWDDSSASFERAFVSVGRCRGPACDLDIELQRCLWWLVVGLEFYSAFTKVQQNEKVDFFTLNSLIHR